MAIGHSRARPDGVARRFYTMFYAWSRLGSRTAPPPLGLPSHAHHGKFAMPKPHCRSGSSEAKPRVPKFQKSDANREGADVLDPARATYNIYSELARQHRRVRMGKLSAAVLREDDGAMLKKVAKNYSVDIISADASHFIVSGDPFMVQPAIKHMQELADHIAEDVVGGMDSPDVDKPTWIHKEYRFLTEERERMHFLTPGVLEGIRKLENLNMIEVGPSSVHEEITVLHLHGKRYNVERTVDHIKDLIGPLRKFRQVFRKDDAEFVYALDDKVLESIRYGSRVKSIAVEPSLYWNAPPSISIEGRDKSIKTALDWVRRHIKQERDRVCALADDFKVQVYGVSSTHKQFLHLLDDATIEHIKTQIGVNTFKIHIDAAGHLEFLINGPKAQCDAAHQRALEVLNAGALTPFKTAMRAVAHPVAVITTRVPMPGLEESIEDAWDCYRGMTVSSFCAVTMLPFPIVSFNIKLPSRTFTALEEHRLITIHIPEPSRLGKSIAETFTKPYDNASDPFKVLRDMKHVSVTAPEGEAPIISGRGVKLAFRCKALPSKFVWLGDHVVVFAQVLHVIGEKQKGSTQSVLDGLSKMAGLSYVQGQYCQVDHLGHEGSPAPEDDLATADAERAVEEKEFATDVLADEATACSETTGTNSEKPNGHLGDDTECEVLPPNGPNVEPLAVTQQPDFDRSNTAGYSAYNTRAKPTANLGPPTVLPLPAAPQQRLFSTLSRPMRVPRSLLPLMCTRLLSTEILAKPASVPLSTKVEDFLYNPFSVHPGGQQQARHINRHMRSRAEKRRLLDRVLREMDEDVEDLRVGAVDSESVIPVVLEPEKYEAASERLQQLRDDVIRDSVDPSDWLAFADAYEQGLFSRPDEFSPPEPWRRNAPDRPFINEDTATTTSTRTTITTTTDADEEAELTPLELKLQRIHFLQEVRTKCAALHASGQISTPDFRKTSNKLTNYEHRLANARLPERKWQALIKDLTDPQKHWFKKSKHVDLRQRLLTAETAHHCGLLDAQSLARDREELLRDAAQALKDGEILKGQFLELRAAALRVEDRFGDRHKHVQAALLREREQRKDLKGAASVRKGAEAETKAQAQDTTPSTPTTTAPTAPQPPHLVQAKKAERGPTPYTPPTRVHLAQSHYRRLPLHIQRLALLDSWHRRLETLVRECGVEVADWEVWEREFRGVREALEGDGIAEEEWAVFVGECGGWEERARAAGARGENEGLGDVDVGGVEGGAGEGSSVRGAEGGYGGQKRGEEVGV